VRLVLLAGIYLVFVTIMCFLSVAMTIIVIHLYTHSVAVRPITVPRLVSIATSVCKGKDYHTPWGVLVGCSSPLARWWINHFSLWRASGHATPDLRLPSQSQDIAAPRLVPNCTAWWQRHMCVNNLPKDVLPDSETAGSWTRDLWSRKPTS